jgi:hypothetical protein
VEGSSTDHDGATKHSMMGVKRIVAGVMTRREGEFRVSVGRLSSVSLFDLLAGGRWQWRCDSQESGSFVRPKVIKLYE